MAKSKPRKKAELPAPPEHDADIYRLVVESAPNAMVMSDAEGRIVLVNAQAEKLFGYDRRELLGESIEALIPARFAARHRGYREDYADAPQTRSMGSGRDLLGVRKDGVEIPIEIGLNPIKTAKGVFFLAAIVDIAERKKAEEKFRLAVEAAPNAMVMVNGDGKIVLANAQAEKLFGYSQAELMGQTIETLVPARFRDTHVGYRKDFHAGPKARAMGAGRDLFGLHKDGREIPIEIGLNPIRTGTETFVLAAVVDITERRELQRKLTESEALAAVGSMAAVMAHEIRNPLGSIVMAAKSIIRGGLSDSDRQIVGAILSEESQRLSRTLQDFLQYARPRQPKLEAADLNHTVAEIVQALKADPALVSAVRLEVSLDESLSPFPHDADQVRQVLWNLILNAVQAVEGKGKLKIATQVEPGRASFSVLDSGPGIDAQSAQKMFEPFFTTKKKGTGLGLAIARRIVSAHGGVLLAENSPEGGARFSMLLPTSPGQRLPDA